MNYTVLGLFRTNEEAKTAKQRLLDANFDASKIDFSAHKSEGEYSEYNYQYKEDENTGGFWNWLFGDDEEQKTRYSRIGSRADIISVYADTKEEAEKAKNILDEVGALDPEEFDTAASTLSSQNINNDFKNEDFDNKIEVIKEDLKVGKRKEETGTVQVRSRIVEKPVQENIRLQNERVYVKRNKVNRPATEADFDGFYEGTIELTETAERAVVSKDARVVEEIEVGKETSTKNKVINDTVRETEVDIDVDVDAEKLQKA